MDTDDVTTTADILKHLPEPKRNEHWAKGALKRGFYSAVQGFHAANLSVMILAPGVAKAFGLEKLTGGEDKLIEKISDLEKKIESYDIEPVKPSYLKSGTSFLLFNSTYLLPVISIGVAAALLTGPFAAIMTAGLVNSHAQMGEAYVHTARRRTPDKSIGHKIVLDEAMENEKFRTSAKINSFIMGSVCLGITLAAGPLARLLGGFTSGALSSLARTPIGGYLTDKMVSAAHKNVVKSVRKPLGKVFSAAAEHGPPFVAAKMAATIAFARAATNKLMDKYIRKEKIPEPVAEQDNNPDHTIVNDNDELMVEKPQEPKDPPRLGL